MQFGLSLPHWGEFADVRLLAEMAHDAEVAGWDGFYIWDHTIWGESGILMIDPWVALTAIALKTEHIRFGPMVTPLPRRRPIKVAREIASLDILSGGRFVLGVGIGGGADEWENLGEEADPKVRGAMLDEALEVLVGLWKGETFNHEGTYYKVKDSIFAPVPVQKPRVPIWVAATWPTKAPLKQDAPYRRAARWDGIFPIARDLDWADTLSPAHMAEIAALTLKYRESDEPFEMVVAGSTSGTDAVKDAELIVEYAQAGVTYWVENLAPHRYGWDWDGPWPMEQLRERIRLGPPKL
ncbi:MAG TPA: LLM class flavin-dependent oxidoreductase [Chloroflexia bacterium]|nr:LLM class flavin-dependent oxidoreductase [Chloroflexia bacterium]